MPSRKVRGTTISNSSYKLTKKLLFQLHSYTKNFVDVICLFKILFEEEIILKEFIPKRLWITTVRHHFKIKLLSSFLR